MSTTTGGCTVPLTRRCFLGGLAAAGAAVSVGAWPLPGGLKRAASAGRSPICIFSKHLQFLDYQAMAETAAEAGFDGVDLSVRPGGHVLPERVMEDLPRAVDAVRKAGLIVPMMTTAITAADDPHTEPILRSAAELGVGYYRMGYLNYDEKLGIADSLKALRRRMAELAAANERHGIHGAYQNHAGTRVGGPVWDLYALIEDLDPRWMGVQYDIRHAVVEGGTSWPLGLELVSPFVRITAIKDFVWAKRNGRWGVQDVPLGEGMVDFGKYFGIVREKGIEGPISLHFEFPMPGDDGGVISPVERRKKTVEVMRRDVQTLRSMLDEAGLS